MLLSINKILLVILNKVEFKKYNWASPLGTFKLISKLNLLSFIIILLLKAVIRLDWSD